MLQLLVRVIQPASGRRHLAEEELPASGAARALHAARGYFRLSPESRLTRRRGEGCNLGGEPKVRRHSKE